MKKTLQKLLLLVALATFSSANVYALIGTYTIGGASPDYTTLGAAITALNNLGITGPVDFVIRDGSYSGSGWQGLTINTIANASATNRVTFHSQSNNRSLVTINGAGSSSGNFLVKLNNANFVSFRDITFVNTNTSYGTIFDFGTTSSSDSISGCTLTGAVSTTSGSTCAIIYAYQHTGSNNTVFNSLLQNGSSWMYIYGVNTTTTTNDWKFVNNTCTMANSGYYGFYSYYASGTKIINNSFTYNGTGVIYANYLYYTNNDMDVANNTYNLTSTTTVYGLYCYFSNYYSASTTLTPRIRNNTITTNNTSGTTYPMYNYYGWYATVTDNTVNATATTGTIYCYAPLYYNNGARGEGNTFNLTGTSSATLYCYGSYNSGSYPDTVQNNTFNFNTVGGTIYNYIGYYGNTLILNNNYNTTNTSGTTYNYIYYSNGIYVKGNKIKSASTTGLIYGLYNYNTTSYSAGQIFNNDFDISSTSGTVYGLYAYYSNGENIFNNVFTTKTSGTNYSLFIDYTTSVNIKNNTFHSNSTSGTQYGIYYSSGTAKLRNNIFSRSTSAASGYGVYALSNSTFDADYNLFDLPGGTALFYCSSPAYSGSSLQGWRTATGRSKNSLVYSVPYTNAAARDLSIIASSPNAWAVNGRAEHDTVIATDFTGAVRPKYANTGVPDMGAYEVIPTSTPPDAIATPASPVINSTQVFTFGQDTVLSIAWGPTVPATYAVRQYTGVQALPMPAGVGRMYFYAAGTPSTWGHSYKAYAYYKDPWLGTIPSESEAVIARSSNNGAWEGYNYTNAATDMTRNILSAVANFDSVGSYTGVQNGRIGIRCVEEPKGITVKHVTAFDADVDWQAVFNPIGYQVVFKKVNEAPTQAEWNSSNFAPTNSLAGSGFTEDTQYYVYVRSICGLKDTSGYAMDSFHTIITCHNPDVKLSSINDNRVVASWGDIKTAVQYEYVLSSTPTPPVNGTTMNKTSVLSSFLDPGVQYYVHVRAHCNTIYNTSAWTTVPFNTWALGVGNVVEDGKGLYVYPNPVRNEMMVTIGAELAGKASISILDMTGKVIKTQPVTANKVALSIGELPSGIYMVQFSDDARREQLKFSKQ